MPIITLALARDPGTPTDVLTALAHVAAHNPQGPYVHTALLAHPNLPDDIPVPGPRGDEHDFLYCDALEDALKGAAITAHTQARLLAATSTGALDFYSESTFGDPAPVEELARRTAGALHPNWALETRLALHHHTPEPRRLSALRLLLASPQGNLSEEVAAQLVTQALHHPQHLRELADVCTDPDTRAVLCEYADHAAAGVDVLARHRARYLTIGSGHAITWKHAIEHTGDPVIADRALDATRNTATSKVVRAAILSSGALRGTPVHRRAIVSKDLGIDVPSADLTTWLDHQLATIHASGPQDAHETAVGARGHRTCAPHTLEAGWARMHVDGDLTKPLDRDAVTTADALSLASYALHPALPDAYRLSAIAAFHEADFSELDPNRRQALTRLVDAAAARGTLHRVLLDTTLEDVRALTVEWHTEQLLIGHLGAALHAHHAQLTCAQTLRAVVALEPTFSGTVAELVRTAHTLTL